MSEEIIFHNPTKGRMDFDKVMNEITGFINENPKRKYDVVIGTDSQGFNGQGEVDFVTAIIVHRVGCGGRYFWRRIYKNGFHTIRTRVYEEVNLSLDLAQRVIKRLNEFFKEEPFPQYGLNIHVDVGENGPTRDMIKEVVGMIRGNGFDVRIKPYSYAASVVADKYV